MKMKKLMVVFLSFMFLVACGGGGGSSDGSSSIQGNIANQVALLKKSENLTIYARVKQFFSFVNDAQAGVSGIVVKVKDQGLSTVSDDSGFFRFSSVKSGNVVLLFEIGTNVLELGLSVPSNSDITIQNISINESTNEVTPSAVSVNSNSTSSSSSASSTNSNSDDNSNTNDNSDDDNDDSNSNSNSNSNSDDDDDDSNSNSNSDDDDDKDDDNSNSGKDDNKDDDNSGKGGGDDDDDKDDDK